MCIRDRVHGTADFAQRRENAFFLVVAQGLVEVALIRRDINFTRFAVDVYKRQARGQPRDAAPMAAFSLARMLAFVVEDVSTSSAFGKCLSLIHIWTFPQG